MSNNKDKNKSNTIYKIFFAVMAVIMILSMIASVIRW
jgi:hypothetical protein